MVFSLSLGFGLIFFFKKKKQNVDVVVFKFGFILNVL